MKFEELKDKKIKIGPKTVKVVMSLNFKEEKKIKQMMDNDEFMHNCGYADVGSGMVWVYMLKPPVYNRNFIPAFWKTEEGKLRFSQPEKDIIKQASIKNISDYSLTSIISNTKEEGSKRAKDIHSVAAESAEMRIPIILKRDDFLKKAIKAIIRKKNISLNGIPRAQHQHLANNMKSALLSETKTSTKYFVNWSDLLSFDYYLIAVDNRRDDFPFESPIVVSSANGDMVSYMNPDDVKKFKQIMENCEPDEWVKALATRNDDDIPADSCEIIDKGDTDDEEDVEE